MILRPSLLLACVVGVLVAPVFSAEVVTKALGKMPELKVDRVPIGPNEAGRVVSFADIVEPVQRGVVSVYSTKIVRQQVDPRLRRFFGDALPQRPSKEDGLGSGVIISADGYILTNNHVVADADALKVSLADGREFKASVIGSDPKTDVAVIKIEASGLPMLTLADSDNLRVGDVVFAVGNPLGIGQTVTMGIVSAKSRNNLGLLDGGSGYENFIQTDAAINMGNSGGALVDGKGRLVGINTAILSTTQGNIGIGFAIPANLAAMVMRSLIETGKVSRGYLGVGVDTLTPDIAEALGLPRDQRGVMVSNINEGSPAEQAGVQREDVIVSIDGKPIQSLQELRLVVSQFLPGTEVRVALLRDAKPKDLAVVLGVLPEDADKPGALLDGVTAAPLTDEDRRRLRLKDGLAGILVTDISEDSPYADQLMPNMVILEINRVSVADVAAAKGALRAGPNLLLTYLRGGYRYLSLTVR